MRKTFAIDIGNTRTGFALVDGDQVLMPTHIDTEDWDALLSKPIWPALQKASPTSIVISSVVAQALSSLKDFLKRQKISLSLSTVVCAQNSDTHLAYKKKERLGSDRLALIHFAQKKVPQDLILLVDAGTTITLDLIVEGKHRGGLILPGFQNTLSCLQQTTHIDFSKQKVLPHSNLFGTETEECIAHGFLKSRLFLFQGIAEHLGQKYGQHTHHYWLTGGESSLFETMYPWTTIDPHLIFRALHLWKLSE